MLQKFIIVCICCSFISGPLSVQAQITYIGSAGTPVDDVNSNTTPQAVTPPGGMQAGDLVLLISHARVTTNTYAISNAGGQVWNTLQANVSNTNISARLFWCKYNGTWSANPSVAFTTSGGNTVVMHVFRPTKPSLRWSIESNQTETDFAAPGASPFTVTIPGRTTRTERSVTIAAWFSSDNNAWGGLAGAGWTVLGNAQYRNSNGTGNSSTYAYQIRTTAGATNSVSKNQTGLGGDVTTSFIITFFEMAYGMASLTDF